MLGLYPNKDAVVVPEPVTRPSGRRSYALLHRPAWDLGTILERERSYPPAATLDERPAIWVSFADADLRNQPPATTPVNTRRWPTASPGDPATSTNATKGM